MPQWRNYPFYQIDLMCALALCFAGTQESRGSSAVPAVAGSSIKSGRIDIGVRKHL